jgi:DNA-binding NarL/FixJ family response regulator
MAESQHKISILVASYRAMNRELYTQALNRHGNLRVAACAASVDQVLRAVQTKEINVALIATTLEDGPLSGFAAVQQIKSLRPQVKPVILFEQSEDQLIVAAFRAGAKGVFCPALEGIKKLCKCVKQVNDGQIWASSAELIEVLEAFSRSAPFRVVDAKGARLLTKREDDVVRLVEEGLTNRQIARELHLSEHTIRNNLFRIFDKLGVSTRVELALYAVNSSKRASPAAPDLCGTESDQKPPTKKRSPADKLFQSS